MARDHTRAVLFASTRRVKAWWPIEITEGKAILMAIKLAKRYRYEDVIVESDCQVIINRLAKEVVFLSDLDNVLEDVIVSISSDFNSIFWSHVRRDDNFVAHHLARLMPFGVQQV